MKNASSIFALLFLAMLSACSKAPLPIQNEESTSEYVYDWVTGTELGTIGISLDGANDRSPDNYINYMSGATTKFGFQANFYRSGILINSTPWHWREAGVTVLVVFPGDNSNEYTMVMNYARKLPSVPCSLDINWSSNCEGYSATESFVIGSSGTTKTHLFLACE